MEEIKNLNPSSAVLSQHDYTYDAAGKILTWQQQADGNTPTLWTEGYDAGDQLTSAVLTNTEITSPAVRSDSYGYDPVGNATTFDVSGVSRSPSYNSLNQLTGSTASGNRTVGFTGALNGAATVTVNGSSATVNGSHYFSGTASLTTGTTATVPVVATDSNGNVTTWGLDTQGRVTSKTYADSTAINYVYETNTSRLHTMTDARGNVATYAYNADNTLSGTTYSLGSGVASTPNVSFTYDTPYNRVLTMADGTGTTTYSYNPINAALGAGRLSSVSVPIAGSSAAVTYGYDELGRVTERDVDHSSTNANNVSTTFDSLGRVTGVSNALGAFTYAYVDQTSRLSGVTYPSGTGLSTSYSYFDNTGDQRLETIQNFTGSGATQLSRFDYTYNPVGTIATWTQQADSSTAVVNTLSYDGADQLTSAVQSGGGSASNAYNYDPAGNRLAEVTGSGTTAGQFNNLNQLTAIGSSASNTVAGYVSASASNVTVNAVPATISNNTNFTANVSLPTGTNVVSVVAQPTSSGPITTKRYQIVTTGTAPTALTYDLNGNVLTDENGNGYTWDALNRLTAIVYNSGAYSGTHTEFAYDGLSRRVQIVERAGTTVGSGTVSSTKNYLWIGQEIAEERDVSNAVTKRFFPQGEQQSGTDYYYTRDHLGSTREVCNSSGGIVARYSYDPYGVATLVSGSNLATYQYADLYAHQTSGLELPVFRGGYDPNVGRFLQRDSWQEKGGFNLYEYAADNPMYLIDPLGFDPTMDVTPGKKGLDSQQVDVSIKGCTCKNVQFIQTVSVNGGPTNIDNPGNTPGDPFYHNLMATSGGYPGAPTTMEDWPGSGIQWGDSHVFLPSLDFFFGLTYNFETCAICLDGGQKKILGCRRWSLHWDAFGRNPTSSGEETNMTPEPPTSDFHKKTGL